MRAEPFRSGAEAFNRKHPRGYFGVMSTAKAGSRAQAIRRARELKTARDQKRFEREKQIEKALTDFLQQTELAAATRMLGEQRAKRLLERSEGRATQHDDQAREAINRLAKLGETVTGIAELTGWPRQRIREVLKTRSEDRAVMRREAALAEGEGK